jgi:hypothetical protein
MTLSEPAQTGMSAAFLSEQWRAASHASIWRTPGDWHSPAIEKMVHAALEGVDAESAELAARFRAFCVAMPKPEISRIFDHVYHISQIHHVRFALCNVWPMHWIPSLRLMTQCLQPTHIAPFLGSVSSRPPSH